jgi:predicted metalloprotease with PDZ domain
MIILGTFVSWIRIAWCEYLLQVNGGSPAEKAGLQAGDAVIRVNDVELFNLRHKEAQDNIVRAGNNFEITVQR